MCSGGMIESRPAEGGKLVMADRQSAYPLWIVVKVESGIPVLAEAYEDEPTAEMREQSLRRSMRAECDETGVFEIQTAYRAHSACMSQ